MTFSNLIRVVMPKKERKRSFAAKGDSGSGLLFQRSDGNVFAVGLIIGGDAAGSYTLATPIRAIEDALDVEVIYAV